MVVYPLGNPALFLWFRRRSFGYSEGRCEDLLLQSTSTNDFSKAIGRSLGHLPHSDTVVTRCLIFLFNLFQIPSMYNTLHSFSILTSLSVIIVARNSGCVLIWTRGANMQFVQAFRREMMFWCLLIVLLLAPYTYAQYSSRHMALGWFWMKMSIWTTASAAGRVERGKVRMSTSLFGWYTVWIT